MSKIIIAYSNKSSVTGRAIANELRDKGHRVVIKRDASRVARGDVFLRWGDTRNYTVIATKHINAALPVLNCVDKRSMLDTLKAANVPIVKYTTDMSQVDEFRDASGGFYVRQLNGETRYDTNVHRGDSYVSKPLTNKLREYRVHVFRGEILGIYEKLPHNTADKLWKAANCQFSKRDADRCLLGNEGLKICVDAVAALGLDYGAVDIMRTKGQRCVISEVNSSAGLNAPNVKRLVERILKLCEQ